jgi:hypothetical protein
MSGDDITLKEFVEKIEKQLDERLDKIESKIDALNQNMVTEARLQSKIRPVSKLQEEFGKRLNNEVKRIDKVEHFRRTFILLLKYVGGPVGTIAMALIIAYLTGLI